MNTNLFFGYEIDPERLPSRVLVLMIAVLLGGLIGLEREWHGNPAGIRTHILVCMGSAVITLTSVEIGLGVRGGMRGDPGHIAAQIVSGIGFLGAGAIMREGVTVRGLTSAASVWATAGIGIALGASPHLGELAVIATAMVLVTLALLEPLEKRLRLKAADQTLVVDVHEAERGPARVLDLLTTLGVAVIGVQCETPPVAIGGPAPGAPYATAMRHMEIRVKYPPKFDHSVLSEKLLAEPGVTAFRVG